MLTMNNRAIFATIKESKRKNKHKQNRKKNKQKQTKTKNKKKQMIIAINRPNDL